MMKFKKYNCKSSSHLLALVLLAVASLLISGCGVSSKNMVPDIQLPTDWKVTNSVRVMDVSSDGPIDYYVENSQLKDALVSTLKKYMIFSDVSTDHGDLLLYAKINSEKQILLPPPMTIMVVTYKFMDRDGNLVWLTTCESEYSSAGWRGWRASEGSVRENLSCLIKGIMEQWSRR